MGLFETITYSTKLREQPLEKGRSPLFFLLFITFVSDLCIYYLRKWKKKSKQIKYQIKWKETSEIWKRIEEQPVCPLVPFFWKKHSNNWEKLIFLLKKQKFCKASKKNKKQQIQYVFIITVFFFKQDLTLAKNKTRTYAIELFIFKQAQMILNWNIPKSAPNRVGSGWGYWGCVWTPLSAIQTILRYPFFADCP